MIQTQPNKLTRTVIFTASVGALLEAYDFTVYAYLAVTLGQVFFTPAGSQLGVVLTFITFAAGYLIRPIGGILFSHIGDRVGRKSGLIYTIIIMGAATFLIGFLPTYQMIGFMAPILLVLLRLIQGIAMGGDLPGGLTYISETTIPHGGRYTGYFLTGISFGCLLAIGAVYGLHALIGDHRFLAWGWRAVFWFSVVLSVLGLYQRRRLHESPAFELLKQQQEVQKIPISSLFKSCSPQFIKAFCLLSSYVLMVIVFTTYCPTYLHLFFKLKFNYALKLTALASVFYTLSFLGSGFLFDRLKPSLARYLPLAVLIIAPSAWGGMLLFGFYAIATVFIFVCIAFLGVSFLRPFSLIFPNPVRYTGIALAFNLLFALSGMAPAILTATIPSTSSPVLLPILLIAGTTILYIVSLLLTPSFSRRKNGSC